MEMYALAKLYMIMNMKVRLDTRYSTRPHHTGMIKTAQPS